MSPRGATTKSKATWTKPVLEYILTFKGGYGLSYPYPVESQTLEVSPGAKPEVFVHIAKNMEWLLQASTGRTERAQLKRCSVFNDLKTKLTDHAARHAAVAAAASPAVPDADDPMNTLQSIDEPQKKKHRAKPVKRCKNLATLVTMPAKEPNKYPNCTETVDVMLMALSTNAMWMRKDDIPWLVEYLADECGPSGSQGVAMLDDGAGDPTDATVVADAEDAADTRPYRLEYDFGDVVAAFWVHGPLKGTPPVASSIKEFTLQKWKTVDAIHGYGVTFDEASRDEIVTAVFDFVESHCETMLIRHWTALDDKP